MAVKTVLRMGDPRLRQVSEPVGTVPSTELDTLITDMWDTMAAYDGAGLAAPQIGVAKRVMIFGVESNPRYPEAPSVPATVLINPQFDVLDPAEAAGWEGCLSVPGMRGLVSRPNHIRYWGVDASGQRIEREAVGFHARVFQHEYDHLDGVLYPDRIDDFRYFGFNEELAAADALADTSQE